MKFTDLFIRRPVIAIVVNLIILIAGVQAIRSLNVRQYPRSENAAITVTTVYVGANAGPGTPRPDYLAEILAAARAPRRRH